MAEVREITPSGIEKGVEVEEWEPGVRERSIGFLRLTVNPRTQTIEEVKIEIDIPESEHGARKEKASFYLS